MEYESRIYVVNYHEHSNWGEVLCMMNLSKMWVEFRDLFANPVDYEVFLEGEYNELAKEDLYGEVLKDTPIQTVIDWTEDKIRYDAYRRLEPLLATLKGFDPSRWDDLRVIHYGY